MATRIKLRSDIAANWAAANPILAAGEIGLVIEGALRRAKVGDGATAWNALDWAFEGGGGGAGGASAFDDLTDAATADLPAINEPLAAALGAMLPASAADEGAVPGTVALRDDLGGIEATIVSATGGKSSISSLETSGPVALHKSGSSDLFSFDFLNIYFAPGSALEFRTKLESGATGDALFTSTSAAEARETLGVRTFRTTVDVSNASQTPANGNVPELTFPVVAGKSYKIDFCFILAAAGGSWVHQIKATYPTASLPSLGDCLGLHRFQTKIPTPGATSLDFNTSTAAASSAGVHSGYWFYRPSASGNVTFQIYNYDATAVTNTLKAGTTVTTTEL